MPGTVDLFLPQPDIDECHQIEIAAPPEVVFEQACNLDLMGLPLVRGVFRAREILLGSKAAAVEQPKGIVPLTKSLGWRALSETPNRELVMGARAQPWLADVVFHGIPGQDFAAYAEPGWVKIAWTIEAIPLPSGHTLFRTQTRAKGTDDVARVKFRRYWRKYSIGILLIRRLMLPALRHQAEQAHRAKQT
jgi:hypothetical protein